MLPFYLLTLPKISAESVRSIRYARQWLRVGGRLGHPDLTNSPAGRPTSKAPAIRACSARVLTISNPVMQRSGNPRTRLTCAPTHAVATRPQSALRNVSIKAAREVTVPQETHETLRLFKSDFQCPYGDTPQMSIKCAADRRQLPPVTIIASNIRLSFISDKVHSAVQEE